MSEKSSRKLIRSPFPLGQLPQVPILPSLEEQKPLDEGYSVLAEGETQENQALPAGVASENRTLADAETRKTPTLLLPENRALADVETRKTPLLRPSFPDQDKNLFIANAQAHYAGIQRTLPISPTFSPPPALVSKRRKKPRTPLTRRKKVQLSIMAVVVLLPSLLIVFELISLFIVYKQMQDGISHLQTAQTIFQNDHTGGIEKYFNSSLLSQAQDQIDASHADFAALSDKMNHDGFIALASNLLPAQIHTIRSLGQVAATGTEIAGQLLQTVRGIAPSVSPALQKSSSGVTDTSLKPYLTAVSYQKINATIANITPLVHSLAQSAQGLDLRSLPISSKQRSQLESVLPFLPLLDAALPQEQEMQSALGWFLGIDGQRSFLIEPMDRAELRATGGFTGQAGALVLNGAHPGPFKLANLGKYEEDHTSEGSPLDETVYPKVVGQTAPAPYSDWWPIGNFGLRDANLSADFPTSARIAIERYNYEFGQSVDGVILFAPALIGHVLHVTGPIAIPAYNQVITEHNLEDLLHYYQLDNTGIRQEELVEHVEDAQVARKLFTQRVTEALLGAVTHLPLNSLLLLGNEMVQSMKSKDLQIYVTNAQLEAFIGKYGSTASLDRSTTRDGMFIVQSNLSANKASQYVTTAFQDSITLDNQGGATHHLQMTLDYQQKGDVYGFDTYRDYVRMYVPADSQLLTGNGFDLYDRPYCGDEKSGYQLCQPDVYGDGSLVCTPPVEIGYATTYFNDPYVGKDHPLDRTGVPPNQQSDEAGRAMFGGWIVIPKNCTMIVTLSWYVPPMSSQPYSLLFQAQAGVDAALDLTVQPSGTTCVSSQGNALHFSQGMDGTDILLTVKQQGTKCSLASF